MSKEPGMRPSITDSGITPTSLASEGHGALGEKHALPQVSEARESYGSERESLALQKQDSPSVDNERHRHDSVNGRSRGSLIDARRATIFQARKSIMARRSGRQLLLLKCGTSTSSARSSIRSARYPFLPGNVSPTLSDGSDEPAKTLKERLVVAVADKYGRCSGVSKPKTSTGRRPRHSLFLFSRSQGTSNPEQTDVGQEDSVTGLPRLISEQLGDDNEETEEVEFVRDDISSDEEQELRLQEEKAHATMRRIKALCQKLNLSYDAIRSELASESLVKGDELRPESSGATLRLAESRTVSVSALKSQRLISNSQHPQSYESAAVEALRRVRAFSGNSTEFLRILTALGDEVRLKARDLYRLRGREAAIFVIKGTSGVFIGRNQVVALCPGTPFNLAHLLAGVAAPVGMIGSAKQDGISDMTVRCTSEECHCLVVRLPALKAALAESPADNDKLRQLVLLLGHPPIVAVQHVLGAVQCGTSMSSLISICSTRHVFLANENLFAEGHKAPKGLILVVSGTVALRIGGVEVRRISEGQYFGHEMLLDVSETWSYTATCVSACDVHIFHREVSLSVLKDNRDTTGIASSEEQRDAQTLLELLEGARKQNRGVISWPLFRGYSIEFISALARSTEIRVTLPGHKLCESDFAAQSRKRTGPLAQEVALYCLLNGACDLIVTKDGKRGKPKMLTVGAAIGVRDFLGIHDSSSVVVVARVLTLTSVLHRAIYLHLIKEHAGLTKSDLVAPEVNKLLGEELDRQHPLEDRLRSSSAASIQWPPESLLGEFTRSEVLFSQIQLLRDSCIGFVQHLLRSANKMCCIVGQCICVADRTCALMNVVVRGTVAKSIGDIVIGRETCGRTLNLLALSSDEYKPAFSAACETMTELWALSHTDFRKALAAYPQEYRRLATLLSDPLQTLAVAGTDRTVFDKRKTVTRVAPVLGDLEIFAHCSLPFLRWIQSHLEAVYYFPDEVVAQGGNEDTSMYIVCDGLVLLEGASESQSTCGAGSTFNEKRALDISDAPCPSTIAVEACIVQVLYRPILREALRLFPEAAAAVDKVAVRLAGAIRPPLVVLADWINQVPLFVGSAKGFRYCLAQSAKTRLVRAGNVLDLEAVASNGAARLLVVLKSGRARIENREGEDPTHLKELEALNAEECLGLPKPRHRIVQAESPCILYEFKVKTLLGAIQRYPAEAGRLCTRCLRVQKLWPPGLEAVPLFANTSSSFFDYLIDSSEWKLACPGVNLATQGRKGTTMYIVCYGALQYERDGIIVGSKLLPGECAGAENFLGITRRYCSSIVAVATSHVRAVSAEALERWLRAHPEDLDKFATIFENSTTQLKELTALQRDEVTKEMFRRRNKRALSQHISDIRLARFGDSAMRTQEKAMKSKATIDRQIDEETIQRQTARTSSNPTTSGRRCGWALSRARNPNPIPVKAPEVERNGATFSWRRFSLVPDCNDELDNHANHSKEVHGGHRPINEELTDEDMAAASQSSGKGVSVSEKVKKRNKNRGMWVIKQQKMESRKTHKTKKPESTDRQVRARNCSSEFSSDDEDVEKGSSSSTNSTSSGSESAHVEPREQLESAIKTYLNTRRENFLRGKLLRSYRSGMELNAGKTNMRLNKNEIEELDALLPKIKPRKKDLVVSKMGSDMPGLTKAQHDALERRFQQIVSSGPCSARLPSMRPSSRPAPPLLSAR